jgi:hypothetical protein
VPLLRTDFRCFAELSRRLRCSQSQYCFCALTVSAVLDDNRAVMQMGYLSRKTKSQTGASFTG